MKRKKKYLLCTSQRREMSERERRRRGGIANRSFTKSETIKERSLEKMEEREGDEAIGERRIKEERIRYWRKGRAYLSLCAVKALKLFWKKERKKKLVLWEWVFSIENREGKRDEHTATLLCFISFALSPSFLSVLMAVLKWHSLSMQYLCGKSQWKKWGKE